MEERFIEALKADLATGKPEQTLPFIAPSTKKVLSAAVLAPAYEMARKQGAVLSLSRDPDTPFAIGKTVRFVLVQEKARTHVRCVFDKNKQLVGYWFQPAPPHWSMEKMREVAKGWKGETAFFVEVNQGDTTIGEGPTGSARGWVPGFGNVWCVRSFSH